MKKLLLTVLVLLLSSPIFGQRVSRTYKEFRSEVNDRIDEVWKTYQTNQDWANDMQILKNVLYETKLIKGIFKKRRLKKAETRINQFEILLIKAGKYKSRLDEYNLKRDRLLEPNLDALTQDIRLHTQLDEVLNNLFEHEIDGDKMGALEEVLERMREVDYRTRLIEKIKEVQKIRNDILNSHNQIITSYLQTHLELKKSEVKAVNEKITLLESELVSATSELASFYQKLDSKY